MSNVAAAAYAPFLSATNAKMFGLNDFRELSGVQDLKTTFESGEYARWRTFRESADSAFVALTMPKVLARVPYGRATKSIEEFAFEETPKDSQGRDKALEHDQYCWMNSSYVLGTKLTQAFAEHGWCTAIRGAEGGGKVTNLPIHSFQSDEGDIDEKCPTEVGIGDRRDYELSQCGFIPLVHYKNTDHAVFFSGQTVHKAKEMETPAATANEEISARLPYVMAVSRFSQYLKIIGRDKIGSYMEAVDCGAWLTKWINRYVNADPGATAAAKMMYPLRDAKVEVTEVPGRPGAYHAIAYLRPWLQMEELTASMRLVAEIPQRK
jgi:type VI secretion system protein ImpC